MALAVLNENLWFPNPDEALEDGLLAIGGNINIERILLAYRNGIFPWYNDDVPLWWHPNPRFVLFPTELKVSKSMKQLLAKNTFSFKINVSFNNVIIHCKNINRNEQDGTWINDEFVEVYNKLHKLGFAYSAETWQNNKLIGGLYGIKIGNIFFGESMFSLKSNASKFAFINFVDFLKKEGVVIIDCQVYTEHLESLGARMIVRNEFMKILQNHINA